VAYLPKVKHIEISFSLARPILNAVGHQLDSLMLHNTSDLNNFDLSEILHLNPNLTFFYIFQSGIFDGKKYSIQPKKLKLKKLFIEETDLPEKLLSLLLKAPLLEEVTLNELIIPESDCKKIANAAKSGMFFKNLKKLKVDVSEEVLPDNKKEYAKTLEDMMKKIIAHSPKLETVEFECPDVNDDFEWESDEEMSDDQANDFESTIGPFLEIVNS